MNKYQLNFFGGNGSIYLIIVLLQFLLYGCKTSGEKLNKVKLQDLVLNVIKESSLPAFEVYDDYIQNKTKNITDLKNEKETLDMVLFLLEMNEFKLAMSLLNKTGVLPNEEIETHVKDYSTTHSRFDYKMKTGYLTLNYLYRSFTDLSELKDFDKLYNAFFYFKRDKNNDNMFEALGSFDKQNVTINTDEYFQTVSNFKFLILNIDKKLELYVVKHAGFYYLLTFKFLEIEPIRD